MAQRLLEIAAQEGINLEIVQGFRSPQAQQALYESGAGVTNAPGGLSYHNYGLAFDVVPQEYIDQAGWNPGGSLWRRIGELGEGIGLEWGGRWSTPDRPHFQIHSSLAPIHELKAYYDRAIAAGKSAADAIMQITISPAAGGVVIIALLIGAWVFVLRPMMQRRGLL